VSFTVSVNLSLFIYLLVVLESALSCVVRPSRPLFMYSRDLIHGDWWLDFPEDLVFPQNHCQLRQSLVFGGRGETDCLGIHKVTLTSSAVSLYGQCCRRHVVGQQRVCDVSVVYEVFW